MYFLPSCGSAHWQSTPYFKTAETHVSLSENRNSQLNVLWPFLKKRLTNDDWVLRSVTVHSTDTPVMSSESPSPLIKAAPSHLWAKNKYGAELIIGRDPVRITPKADYRPQTVSTRPQRCCQHPSSLRSLVQRRNHSPMWGGSSSNYSIFL